MDGGFHGQATGRMRAEATPGNGACADGPGPGDDGDDGDGGTGSSPHPPQGWQRHNRPRERIEPRPAPCLPMASWA